MPLELAPDENDVLEKVDAVDEDLASESFVGAELEMASFNGTAFVTGEEVLLEETEAEAVALVTAAWSAPSKELSS